jgi:NADH-quinone oxidoreductase subunit E
MTVRRLAPAEIQPPAFAFTPENQAWADGEIRKYPPGRQMSAVIPLLWRAQEQEGWVTQKAIEAIAQKLDMPVIRVLEVATFYSMFNLEPVGRHLVQLCGTVPCHVKGALELKEMLHRRLGEQHHVTADGLFSWVEVECLGACCNAPMVQINADYYEDLTPQVLEGILDDLAAGRPVKPGPQNGRVSSEPLGGAETLQDPALFDGSLLGTWRKRLEERPVNAPNGEASSTEQRAASEPKQAKPDAGRAIERPASNAPAQRAADGEPPVSSGDRARSAEPSRATHAEPKSGPETIPGPQSSKSYTPTPSKPEEGRPVAASAGTTPIAGTPPSQATKPRDGTEAKPVGVDPTDKAPPDIPGQGT